MIPVVKNEILEKTILASALFVDGVADEMSYGLTAEDFTMQFHRSLFTELKTCSIRGYTPDVSLIANRINKTTNMSSDAYVEISSLTNYNTSSNIKPHIAELRAYSDARRIVDMSSKVLSSANNISDVKDWVNSVFGKMGNMSKTGNEKSQLKHISSYNQKAMDTFEAIARGEEIGIKTGIESIDRQTNGIRKGEYVIFGGRPGAGKTSLGLTVSKNVAKQGKKVGIFSIEVKGHDIVFKLCSMISSERATIPYSVFRGRRKVESHHLKLFGEYLAKLNDMGIFINDSGKTTMTDIEIELRRFIIREQLDMVVIDHIGIVKNDSPHSKKRNEILQDLSIRLAELFKDLDVAGLVLIQLKRSKTNEIPTMDDLAECSQFEKDAHLIYLIHIPDLNNVSSKLLCCVKARDTAIGVFPVEFSTETTEFKSSTGYKF